MERTTLPYIIHCSQTRQEEKRRKGGENFPLFGPKISRTAFYSSECLVCLLAWPSFGLRETALGTRECASHLISSHRPRQHRQPRQKPIKCQTRAHPPLHWVDGPSSRQSPLGSWQQLAAVGSCCQRPESVIMFLDIVNVRVK